MKTVDLPNWESFEDELKSLFGKYPGLPETEGWIPNMLFRGQSDASWQLQTTLERYPVRILNAGDYYLAISAAKLQIETYTNQSWEILDFLGYKTMLESKKDTFGLFDFPAYEYMVYLRHHGFPSPLLDWTFSPYVAAFFAFHSGNPKTTHVSI